MNPYKPGDFVIIMRDVKDAYGDVWHDKGDSIEVIKIASDGNGLMFSSQLGIHYSEVIPDLEKNRDRKLNEILK